MNDPTISIVGRTGVGKTTLFNRICFCRNITSPEPDTTADLVKRPGKLHSGRFGSYFVSDTLGWQAGERGSCPQFWKTIKGSAAFILVLDRKAGITAGDRSIVSWLAKSTKPVIVAVNKSDPEDAICRQEFSVGGCAISFVSASHNIGIGLMMEGILRTIRRAGSVEGAKVLKTKPIVVAVVGQRNAGKSTLINSVLRERLVHTSERPGTTRDQVTVPYDAGHHQFRLQDTAGYLRRDEVRNVVGRQSVLQSFRAVSKANIVLLVVDASVGFTNRDRNVLDFASKTKVTTLLVFSKHDQSNYRTFNLAGMRLSHRTKYFVSALKRRGISNLTFGIRGLAVRLYTNIPTGILRVVLRHHILPDLSQSGRQSGLKLGHLHQGGSNPPIFVFHGHNVHLLSRGSAEHIVNIIRSKLNLEGIGIGIRLVEEPAT